jgi:hypothetical protein
VAQDARSVNGLQVEKFVYQNWEFWIGAARDLVADRQPVDIDVCEFAPLLALADLTDGPSITTGPVLVCELAAPVDGRHRLLIDGWHRLRDAHRCGVTTLPAKVLAPHEWLTVSGRHECHGCGHCVHIPFDLADDGARCYTWCEPCADALCEP